MTWNNDQWQEALVALANSGLSAASNGPTGSAVPAQADYVGFGSGGNLIGVDSTHGLPVNIVAGGGSGGTALADDAAFTVATTSFTPVGGVYNDSAAAATSGHADAARLSQNRGLHVNIRNNAGTELATAANPLQVSQQAAASASATLQNAQNASANGTTLNVLGMSVATWTVTMTGFTGTVNFEGTEDGSTWTAISVVQLGTTTITTTTTGSTTTSTAVFESSVGGLQTIRARTSGVSAGTVTVTSHAVPVNFAARTVNAINLDASGNGLTSNSTTYTAKKALDGNLLGTLGTAFSTAGKVDVKAAAGDIGDVNSGTIGASTLRTVAGGAATGTKSNVASSASSVTVLASNTSRKGAIIYNDSTQILYLDLSGGTASSSSYSVQIPSQGFFELPGPNLYNGAITGIWASANGNARVTEFS